MHRSAKRIVGIMAWLGLSSRLRGAIFTAGILGLFAFVAVSPVLSLDTSATTDDDTVVAQSLATMLRAGRTVISRNQDLINNASVGDKGLDGKTVLAQTKGVYTEMTKVDPATIDPTSRQGRLLAAQMQAIVEVVDANQKTINEPGVGFKGLIPATFARLVNEAFAKRVGSEALVKVTAP